MYGSQLLGLAVRAVGSRVSGVQILDVWLAKGLYRDFIGNPTWNPKNIVGIYKNPHIPTMFLLHSWGSLFKVPMKVLFV